MPNQLSALPGLAHPIMLAPGLATFAVIAHMNKGVVLHIDWYPFGRALEIPPTIKRLPEWTDGSGVSIQFLGVFSDRIEAMVCCRDSRRIMQPKYQKVRQLQTPIRCVTDGTVFESVRAAAEAFDVTSSYISNHLARRKGYATIKGFVFEKI